MLEGSMESARSPEEKMYGFYDNMRMNRTSMLVKQKELGDISSKVDSIVADSGETAEECVKSVMSLEELNLKRRAAEIEIRKMMLENSALHSSIEELKSKVKVPEGKAFTGEEEDWFSQGDRISDEFEKAAVKAIGKAKGGKISGLETLPVEEGEIEEWLEKAA